MYKAGMVILVSVLLLNLGGCGGGSGSPVVPTQRTATIVFSAMSTATLPTAISGIRVSALLPSGVTVATVGANEISSAVLTSPKQGALINGSYSPATMKVSIDLAGQNLGFGNIGDYAQLVCSFPGTLNLTEGSFLALNQTFPDFNATGVFSNMSGTSTVTLTDKLKPSMRVIVN